MASYPTAVPSLANPTVTDKLDSTTVPHATQHANANDEIEAICTELGTLPKGSKADVKTRIADAETLATHTNRTLLDTYTQTEVDLADAVTKKHANTTDHAATLLGTKTLDETDIGNAKVLTYNSTSGKIEYETPMTAASVLASAYPVGCIYTTTVSTNPATVFGFGTWEAFGSGKVLIGLDAGQTELDSVEETGGSSTISEANLPSHSHAAGTLAAANESAHTHAEQFFSTGSAGGNVQIGTGPNGTLAQIGAMVTGAGSAHTHTISGSTGTIGSGTKYLQPYIVVYFFKRTA